MWTALFSGIGSIFSGWVKLKTAKQEAKAKQALVETKGEQDWDTTALRMSESSWKDELITIIIFSPLIVAWFDQERAMAWVEFVKELPVFYQIFMSGIICASFGLRWFFKQQGFKLGSKGVDDKK
jgi:hypothetical protein